MVHDFQVRGHLHVTQKRSNEDGRHIMVAAAPKDATMLPGTAALGVSGMRS